MSRPPYNNRPQEYEQILVEPMAAALGAQIVLKDGDLQTASPAVLDDIEAALYAHGVVVLKDSAITHGRHEEITAHFGEFGHDFFTDGVDGHPDIQPVVREADEHPPIVFGGGWHTDSAFLERPPVVSILRSVVSPPFGGDTQFSSTRLAYQALSPAMQALLDPLVGLYSRAPTKRAIDAVVANPGLPLDIRAVETDALEAGTHPLVRVHPVTGDRALYADDHYLVGIEGLTRKESAPLVEFLASHVTDPVFTCRIRWEADMVVLWDNRLVIHLAIDDVDGHRREMYRSTVRGEVPIPVEAR